MRTHPEGWFHAQTKTDSRTTHPLHQLPEIKAEYSHPSQRGTLVENVLIDQNPPNAAKHIEFFIPQDFLANA